ncbi:hypothetical protein SAMN02949497_3579 [Methylomagnum ishizawai]|uniref:PEP-CTERM sorting domain-containing protein n=1 Tax=Methylomagnum ishizawai TaxID=1760988 RepID=A0A1Y6D191_9GAMM|nr:hypothetical protein [Methylomagnum ishizawai]SMF96190.1 hypothetical protein SAMN02949497_3579 [Methylomagnum ishizawai]
MNIHPNRPLTALTLALALAVAGTAHNVALAEVLPVQNPSFEELPPEVSASLPGGNATQLPGGMFVGSLNNFQIPGWEVYNPDGIGLNGNFTPGLLNPNNPGVFDTVFDPAQAPDGHHVALLWGDHTQVPGPGPDPNVANHPLGLQQTLAGVTLQPDTRYLLSVDVGNIGSGLAFPFGNTDFANLEYFDLDGFPGYAVQLLAGATIITQRVNIGIPLEGKFKRISMEVAVTSVEEWGALMDDQHPLTIRLVNLNVPGTQNAPGIEVDFDNVRLETQPLETGVSPTVLWKPKTSFTTKP